MSQSYDIDLLLEQLATFVTIDPLARIFALELDSSTAGAFLGVGFVMDTWRQHVTAGWSA